MRASHLVVEKMCISYKGRGFILGVSHIVVEKEGIFWQEKVLYILLA